MTRTWGGAQNLRLFMDGQEMTFTDWSIDYYQPTSALYSLGSTAPQVVSAGPPEMTIRLGGVHPAGPALPPLPPPSPARAVDIVTHAAQSCCCRHCPGDCR